MLHLGIQCGIFTLRIWDRKKGCDFGSNVINVTDFIDGILNTRFCPNIKDMCTKKYRAKIK